MGDLRLSAALFIFFHDVDGAMGSLSPTCWGILGEIAQNLPDSVSTGLTNLPVFIGPVQNDNGFVLYSVEEDAPDELPVGLTQSMDILIEAASGAGFDICAFCSAMPVGDWVSWRAKFRKMHG